MKSMKIMKKDLNKTFMSFMLFMVNNGFSNRNRTNK